MPHRGLAWGWLAGLMPGREGAAPGPRRGPEPPPPGRGRRGGGGLLPRAGRGHPEKGPLSLGVGGVGEAVASIRSTYTPGFLEEGRH